MAHHLGIWWYFKKIPVTEKEPQAVGSSHKNTAAAHAASQHDPGGLDKKVRTPWSDDAARRAAKRARIGMEIPTGMPSEEYEHRVVILRRLARVFGISEDDDDTEEQVENLWDQMFGDMLPSTAASAIEHLTDMELMTRRERVVSQRGVIARVAHFVEQAASPNIAFPEGYISTHDHLIKSAHLEIASQLSDNGRIEVVPDSITPEVVEAHFAPLQEEVRLKEAVYAAAKEKEAAFHERLGRLVSEALVNETSAAVENASDAVRRDIISSVLRTYYIRDETTKISLSFVRRIQWSNAMCFCDVDDAELQAEIANHLTRRKSVLEAAQAARAALGERKAELCAERDALVQKITNLESDVFEQTIAVMCEIVDMKDKLVHIKARLSGRKIAAQWKADARTAKQELAKQIRQEDNAAGEQAKLNTMGEARAPEQERKQEYHSQSLEVRARKIQRLASEAMTWDQQQARDEARRLRRHDAGFAN
eukprot:CAMPEP_0115844278 /NCGR_PEP_ID=MMETSP0287-20121206/8749_1 /TAXON_ID=412157 /ORGANISM="Chrysochromulina rotalis, Strain UIO044" /LENGTH=479 /DNA_ID=CAMNT_0003298005 /DNA_START=41 /DNA_END=1478 /DNA_ORIENTATION=+